MRMNRQIVLRMATGFVASILALCVVVAALVYSGPPNRDAVSAVARAFFVQMWKGSQNRSATTNAPPSATPEGRTIQ